MRELAQADPAQPELAEHGARPPAPIAPAVVDAETRPQSTGVSVRLHNDGDPQKGLSTEPRPMALSAEALAELHWIAGYFR